MATMRADWGNPLMRGFTSETRPWHLRFAGIAASEFFKVSIRRHPEGAEVWAWALEWNQNFRLIGFFGNEGEVDSQIGKLSKKIVGGGEKTEFRSRADIALLPEEEDDLFVVKDADGEGAST